MLEVVAGLDAAHIAGDQGFGTTWKLLAAMLDLNAGQAIPVVLGGDGEPLDVGRSRRTVPLGIRRALVARDRGCRFPGCDRAPALCHAHHVTELHHHGHPKVKNCLLLCPTHHRWVHVTGWDIHPRKPRRVPTTRYSRPQPRTTDQPAQKLIYKPFVP